MSQQPQDDPEIAARMQAHREAQRKASVEGMTVAQRLMRAAALRTVTISLPDDTPDGIPVEVYVPTRADLDRILKLTSEVTLAGQRGETAKEAQLVDELYQIFAGLCVDPSLDVEFWRSGQYGMSEYLAIQDGLFETTLELREDARKFRQKSRR